MSKYIVYLRTNTVNGKQYVGQTNDLKKRNRCFNCLKSRYNKHLDEERKKFGVDCFKVEVLAEVETREEAWKLEEEYIAKLNTIFPNGYNRAYGGKANKGGNKGYHNGKEFQKGDEPWNKGVKGTHFSPDTEFKPIAVVRLEKNGNFSKMYERVKDVIDDGFYTTAVCQCCKGKRKTSGGFKWMYKSDYEKMIGEAIAPPTII